MPSPDDPSNPTPRATRVLLVEDDYTMREVVSRYLRRKGYLVETAVDGADGLKKLTESPADAGSAFDLLITDLNMPNLNGIGLIRAIRHYQIRLRIIACSSAFTPATLQELNSLAVDATLSKTLMADSLVSVVEKVVRSNA